MATRILRRRSRFIKARTARKLALARSEEIGLYKTKCAPSSKAPRSLVLPSTIATATACLLQGAERALLSTSDAVCSSEQSTMTASNL